MALYVREINANSFPTDATLTLNSTQISSELVVPGGLVEFNHLFLVIWRSADCSSNHSGGNLTTVLLIHIVISNKYSIEEKKPIKYGTSVYNNGLDTSTIDGMD